MSRWRELDWIGRFGYILAADREADPARWGSAPSGIWLSEPAPSDRPPGPADQKQEDSGSSVAQLAEHSAVNRRVAGSSPAGGANRYAHGKAKAVCLTDRRLDPERERKTKSPNPRGWRRERSRPRSEFEFREASTPAVRPLPLAHTSQVLRQGAAGPFCSTAGRSPCRPSRRAECRATRSGRARRGEFVRPARGRRRTADPPGASRGRRSGKGAGSVGEPKGWTGDGRRSGGACKPGIRQQERRT